LKPVTVVIPHWNGEGILRRCLLSLRRTAGVRFETLVVDNASTDGSIDSARRGFPEIRIIRSPANLGYAGGCNLGIRNSSTPYVALLNNDAEVTPGWLRPLVEALERDAGLSAVQPKILSIQDPGRFDYCGAAGGELDIFGYPFARGRIFDSIETDAGQYDDPESIFWATGAATLLRRSALDRVGLLDASFFAHMEEIDLDWRMHRAGYRAGSVPRAVVFHQTGGTLGGARFRKLYLNHRNSLIMILKNHGGVSLMWILPIRLMLEGMTCLMSLFTGRLKRLAAVPAAVAAVIWRLPSILRDRRRTASLNQATESALLHGMYRGSIALDYFVRRVRRYSQLEKRASFFVHRAS
jgi:GT2 family glycosyltransferase